MSPIERCSGETPLRDAACMLTSCREGNGGLAAQLHLKSHLVSKPAWVSGTPAPAETITQAEPQMLHALLSSSELREACWPVHMNHDAFHGPGIICRGTSRELYGGIGPLGRRLSR